MSAAEPIPLRPALPEVTPLGLGYTLDLGPLGLVLAADRLRESGGDLSARLRVTSTRSGLPTVIHNARANLSSSTARATLARHLELACGRDPEGRQRIPAADWLGVLNHFCDAVDRQREEGEPIRAGGLEPVSEESPWAVERLVAQTGISLIYGPRGAGKGFLSVALAVCMQLGLPFCGLLVERRRPLYLDKEDSFEVFNGRVRAVCAGLGIAPIAVDRWVPRRRLSDHTEFLARQIAEQGYGALIHDSVQRLSGGPGEHASWESIAIEYAEAVALLGPVAHLLIDHVSADGQRQGLAGKAVGADRKMADARVSWEIRNAQEAESNFLDLGLYHIKRNNTRQFAPIGLRVEFESDAWGRATSVAFRRQDVRDVAALVARLALPEQVVATLRRLGRVTAEDVALELGITESSARRELAQLTRAGRSILVEGGRGRGRVGTWDLAGSENAQNAPPPNTPPLRAFCSPPRSGEQNENAQAENARSAFSPSIFEEEDEDVPF